MCGAAPAVLCSLCGEPVHTCASVTCASVTTSQTGTLTGSGGRAPRLGLRVRWWQRFRQRWGWDSQPLVVEEPVGVAGGGFWCECWGPGRAGSGSGSVSTFHVLCGLSVPQHRSPDRPVTIPTRMVQSPGS